MENEVAIKRERKKSLIDPTQRRLGGDKAQGFAAIKDAAIRSEMARRGGKRAHELGLAHKWTAEEARAAGRVGGLAKNPNKGRRKRL